MTTPAPTRAAALAARVRELAERIDTEDNDFDLATAAWTWWQETAEELAEAAVALADTVGVPCDHDDGSTTYLRLGQGADGSDLFEDTCDTCGEVFTARTLTQIEAALPGFTAASARVGETSLPTPPGPPPTLDEDDEDSTICPRHGGPWGGDETCPRCTTEDGSPRVAGR